jgi:hypothetical protein
MNPIIRVLVTMLAAGMVSSASAQTIWTVQKTITQSGDSIYLNSVHQAGSLFIGFGAKANNSAIFTSPDGINWTFRSQTPGYFYSVAYTGSRYVAIGESNSSTIIGISTNGYSWSLKTLGRIGYFPSITWSGTQLVAAGYVTKSNVPVDFRGEYGTILSSTDGTTWTVRYEDSTMYSSLNSVIWTGSRFIAVGQQGRCVTSPNGTTWTAVWLPLRANLTSVVWTGAFIVTTGEQGGSIVSTDGINWTIAAVPIPSSGSNYYNALPLVWSGKSLVLASNNDTSLLRISTDGINWNMQALSQVSRIRTILFTGTQFIAYGFKSIFSNDTLLILTAPLDSSSAVSPLAKKYAGNYFQTVCNYGPLRMVRYSLYEPAHVTLRFFDLRGREVFSGINQTQGPGNYVFQLPAASLAQGKYVQVFEAGKTAKREMVVLGR